MVRKLVLVGSLLALMAGLAVAAAAAKGPPPGKGPPPRPVQITVNADEGQLFVAGSVVSLFWRSDTYTLRGLAPSVPMWVSLDLYADPTCATPWDYNWWSVYEPGTPPSPRPVLYTDSQGNAMGHYNFPDALPALITALGSPIGIKYTFGYEFTDGKPSGLPSYYSDCATIDLP